MWSSTKANYISAASANARLDECRCRPRSNVIASGELEISRSDARDFSTPTSTRHYFPSQYLAGTRFAVSSNGLVCVISITRGDHEWLIQYLKIALTVTPVVLSAQLNQ